MNTIHVKNVILKGSLEMFLIVVKVIAAVNEKAEQKSSEPFFFVVSNDFLK